MIEYTTTSAAATLFLADMSALFKYTPAQQQQFDWAVAGIKDHIDADWPDVAPEIKETGSLHKWLLSELKYRLTEQLPDMAADTGKEQNAHNDVRAAREAWRRLEIVVTP